MSTARSRRRFALLPRWALAAALLLLLVAPALAHDLFLRPDDFFVSPNSAVRVRVLNSNFERSEAAVTFDRVTDFTLVGPSGSGVPPRHDWRILGDTSMFTLRVGAAGTYLVGLSTAPRVLAETAEDFNDYLESDGVPDILEARRRTGALDLPVHELYSKHVKAVVQVGSEQSAGFDRALGYPAEVITIQNPYLLRAGDELEVQALVDGRPVANQFLMAGGRTPSGARLPVQTMRTDSEGIGRIRLASGAWYVKFIHMVPVSSDSIDYESKWATLTFAVR